MLKNGYNQTSIVLYCIYIVPSQLVLMSIRSHFGRSHRCDQFVLIWSIRPDCSVNSYSFWSTRIYGSCQLLLILRPLFSKMCMFNAKGNAKTIEWIIWKPIYMSMYCGQILNFEQIYLTPRQRKTHNLERLNIFYSDKYFFFFFFFFFFLSDTIHDYWPVLRDLEHWDFFRLNGVKKTGLLRITNLKWRNRNGFHFSTKSTHVWKIRTSNFPLIYQFVGSQSPHNTSLDG